MLNRFHIADLVNRQNKEATTVAGPPRIAPDDFHPLFGSKKVKSLQIAPENDPLSQGDAIFQFQYRQVTSLTDEIISENDSVYDHST